MNNLIEIILYPMVFLLLWLAVSGLISLIGGWFFLARKFPFSDEMKGTNRTFMMQTMRLGFFTSYRSCMNVAFYAEGIKFSPFVLLRFLHSPIFIPWKEIENHSTTNFIFKRSVFFIGGKRIVLFGQAAKHLQDQLEILPS